MNEMFSSSHVLSGVGGFLCVIIVDGGGWVSAVVSLGVCLGVSLGEGVGLLSDWGTCNKGGVLTGGVGGFIMTSCKEYVLLILPQCIWMLSVLWVRSNDIMSV